MPRIPDSFLDRIRETSDIESVVSGYVNLKRRGKTLVGLCPFHNEKTPSFTVYPDNNSYYCFGCGAGGSVIEFVRNIEHLDFYEAVKMLADRAGLQMPEETVDDGTAKLRRRIFEANREAARFFHETLKTEAGKPMLAYLQRRKVPNEMITHFGLGAAPDDWRALYNYLREKGFRDDELLAADLVRKGTSKKDGKTVIYDRFRNKVMYPIIDVRGNVVAFGGRVLDNSKPKYLNTGDTLAYKKSRELYALNFAKNGNDRQLILCEGYMDVIALHSAGFTNAVAGCGTALTDEQVSLISRYADDVLLCYDSDEAGQKAAQKALALFGKTGVHIKVIRMEGGKDADEIIREFGKERFRKLLDDAENDVEYKLTKLKRNYAIDTNDGKIGFLKEAAVILAREDPLTVDLYSSQLADELGVAKNAVVSQVRAVQKSNDFREKKTRLQQATTHAVNLEKAADPERIQNLRAARAEDILLITLLNNNSFYRKLENRLSPDLFVTPLNRKIYEVITSRIAANEPCDSVHLSRLLEPQEMAAVARLYAQAQTVTNSIAACEDCIRVLEDEKRKANVPDAAGMDDRQMLDFIRSLRGDANDKN